MEDFFNTEFLQSLVVCFGGFFSLLLIWPYKLYAVSEDYLYDLKDELFFVILYFLIFIPTFIFSFKVWGSFNKVLYSVMGQVDLGVLEYNIGFLQYNVFGLLKLPFFVFSVFLLTSLFLFLSIFVSRLRNRFTFLKYLEVSLAEVHKGVCNIEQAFIKEGQALDALIKKSKESFNTSIKIFPESKE